MTEQERKQTSESKKGWTARWQALGNKERKLILKLSVILLAGLTLMYIAGIWGEQPSHQPLTAEDGGTVEPRATMTATEEDLEAKLLRILAAVEGAGEVQVALSFRESATAEYVINNETSQSTSEENEEGGKLVVSEQASQSQTLAEIDSQPVLIKETMPLLCGAVIVAAGADDPAVRENLYKAARTLLGLPGHRIEVLKLNL